MTQTHILEGASYGDSEHRLATALQNGRLPAGPGCRLCWNPGLRRVFPLRAPSLTRCLRFRSAAPYPIVCA